MQKQEARTEPDYFTPTPAAVFAELLDRPLTRRSEFAQLLDQPVTKPDTTLDDEIAFLRGLGDRFRAAEAERTAKIDREIEAGLRCRCGEVREDCAMWRLTGIRPDSF